MCLRYKILMQIRGLAIHDGLESEKRNFLCVCILYNISL